MEIIRAEHMGFCFGVIEAVNICENIFEMTKNSTNSKYIVGKLVHNDFVINNLKEKGFKILQEYDIIEDRVSFQKDDIVVIRAHGVSKKLHEKLGKHGVKIYDATCVFVKNIKEKIIEAVGEGYEILFVGDINHPEVKGIISYSKKIQVVKNVEEAMSLNIDSNKRYLLTTQTTLNKIKFEEIKDYFMGKHSNVVVFNKICGATHVRQEAVRKLALKVDILLVVGGKDSSNTKKLYEISKSINENTYLIEDQNGLEGICFDNNQRIGITAGASTPEEIIKNIEKKIKEELRCQI